MDVIAWPCWTSQYSIPGLEDDLRAVVFFLVEHVIALRRTVQGQSVRDDVVGLELACDDHLHELIDEVVNGGLPALYAQAFVDPLAQREVVVRAAVHTHDADAALAAYGAERHLDGGDAAAL